MTTQTNNKIGRYSVKAVEQKWRTYWEQIDLYRTGDDPNKPTYYILDYFPYPSGEGLSVGHCRNYVPTCVAARFKRMNGYNVLHPMGWDAFGLPAENYAIQHGIHPRETTKRFSDNYRRQMKLVECSYDWSREINSTDPDYYRWTQWFFLLLFRRGLAYQAMGNQWWCPKCQTILANEQVENGRCWRCDSEVTTKELKQWYFKITAYADRLLADLDTVDWPERIKAMQRNWIGRSEGEEVSYKMHDWLISRQRYWGTPIPIVHCPVCGVVPVPETQLPVLLPEINDFAPAGDGRSPLVRVAAWVNTTCPQCGGPAERETDTMDGFACSSWYFLRFANPHYQDGPFDPEAVARWLPIDLYVGGAEHAVMHLLYARFWTKVMYDAGLISFTEPFSRLMNQGVLASPIDGRRMSKSRGNVITPDEVVAKYGTDALRVYVLFLGPFDADVVWDDTGIRGITRFLNRYYQLAEQVGKWASGQVASSPPHPLTDSHAQEFERERHKIIKRVTEDMAAFRFNTAVSALMEYLNYLEDSHREHRGHREKRPSVTPVNSVADSQWRTAMQTFTVLLAPLAPFVTEEVWQNMLGQPDSVHRQSWPTYDETQTAESHITIVVQVNGKVRDRIAVAVDAPEETIKETAVTRPDVQKHIHGKPIRQVFTVPGKLVNIVV